MTKIDDVSEQLVDNIAVAVVEVQSGKINIIEFIKEINRNMESYGKKIKQLGEIK